jgi:IclR family transcriptional regulator, KDG regulon repressor
LRRTAGGQATFALGLRLLELGAAASKIDPRVELRPVLRVLTERTEETSNLAVLVGGEAVVVDQVESPHAFRMFARVGRSVPVATSSLGKVLFAFASHSVRAAAIADADLPARTPNSITSRAALARELESVRAAGYALDREENRLGVVCVGAPVRDLAREVVAAISISGPSVRVTGAQLDACIDTVRTTAEAASRALGYRPRDVDDKEWSGERRDH